MKRAIALAGGALGAWVSPVVAQTPPVTPEVIPAAPITDATQTAAGQQGVLIFDTAFFASFGPNTAYEMVQRLPGFVLDIGNTDARGLAGAAGNVLINGDRPASKSDTLDQILRRISADSVERVELIRGGAPGIDMQGRSVVANFILKRTARTEVVAETNTYAYPDGFVGPQARLQYSRRAGDDLTEGALFATRDRTENTAQGHRYRYDATGDTIQRADLDLWDRTININGRGTIQRGFVGGKLRLNALVDYSLEKTSQAVAIQSGAGVDNRNADADHDWKGELGLNWTRALGPRTDLEITGLKRNDSSNYDSESDSGGQRSTFDSDATSGESIARAVLKFRSNDRWAFEGGGEVAYNFLDSSSAYSENGVAIPLPNASIRVSELRGEAFGQATWHPTSKLTVEAGLRAELSRISQTGDTNLSRSFVYPKPRLLLTWLPSNGNQFRFRIEHTVGQLDFEDFAASTEINLGTVAGGNADLEPQKNVIYEAVYERRFWGKGVIEFTGSHTRLRDVIDIIPLAGGIDAVGNIGNGTSDYFQARLTLPLDRLGLSNALLQTRGSWAWSSVTDPLTGTKRRLSEQQAFGCGITFSHDLKGGRFSYGADHGCNADRYSNYRVREVRDHDASPFVTIYGQWKPSSDLTVRLDLGNITDIRARNTRTLYSGPRNVSPLAFREDRITQQGRYLFLQVRKVV